MLYNLSLKKVLFGLSFLSGSAPPSSVRWVESSSTHCMANKRKSDFQCTLLNYDKKHNPQSKVIHLLLNGSRVWHVCSLESWELIATIDVTGSMWSCSNYVSHLFYRLKLPALPADAFVMGRLISRATTVLQFGLQTFFFQFVFLRHFQDTTNYLRRLIKCQRFYPQCNHLWRHVATFFLADCRQKYGRKWLSGAWVFSYN